MQHADPSPLFTARLRVSAGYKCVRASATVCACVCYSLLMALTLSGSAYSLGILVIGHPPDDLASADVIEAVFVAEGAVLIGLLSQASLWTRLSNSIAFCLPLY